MTETALREALHEVASVGVGPVTDARLAVMADLARGGYSVSGGGGRRRWVVGAVAVAAVAALVAVGVAQALRPVEVTPASGPGSLPDQLFPSREHILTLEQAPIGRVSMVYAGARANGGSAWIAVGADSDEYRWVGPLESPRGEVDSEPTQVAVSPDGSMVAVGYSGGSAEDFRVEVISAASGEVGWLSLSDSESDLGGVVETLSWSPSGARLAAEVQFITDEAGSSKRWTPDLYVGDIGDDLQTIHWTASGRASRNESQLVGWRDRDRAVSLAVRAGRGGVLWHPNRSRPIGRIVDVPTIVSPQSLAAGSPLLAGLDDSTPNISGDGGMSLRVYDTTKGQLVREAVGMGDLFTDVVGWRDSATPVVSQVVLQGEAPNNGNVVGQLVAYPVGATPEVLTEAPIGTKVSYYQSARVAQDVVAGGRIREARPPDQSWYDLRTLGPTVRDWVSEYLTLVVLSVVLLVGVVVAGVTRLSRRRRAAHSRSSA